MHASMPWISPLLIALTAVGLTAQKTPEQALSALAEGNRRFCADRSVPQPLGEGVRRSLAKGQSPFAVVLCCSDSRVPPEHIFNCGLGELFVIRVAGNTCDTETLASVEYAVEHLNTPLVVVLGHESCGAVAAATQQVLAVDTQSAKPAASRVIQGLLEQIEPAVRKARKNDYSGKELHNACEEENVHLTLHECLRRSELLRRYVQVGRLQLVPARYHLDCGEVEWLPLRPLPPEPRHEIDHSLHSIPPATPPHVALRMLQAGHRRFLGDGLPSGVLNAERREALTHGQQPLSIVLTCADSRVAPEHVFDAGLGELFVIRVAGNVVNDDVLASIEYAATHTGSSLLIVMGHTGCGAVTAAADHPEGQQLTPNMRALLARLEPSIEKVRPQAGTRSHLVELAVRANVLRSATEVMSRSQVLRSLEQKGRFTVLPTIYDIATGDLAWLKSESDGLAAPLPAPSGETTVHGQPPHGGHGESGHEIHTGDGGQDAHGGQIVPDVLVDWSDSVPPPSSHAPAGHGAPGGPTGHGGDEHDSHGASPDDHDDHGQRGHAATKAGAGNPWLQPIPIIGMAGIASLLLAAFLAFAGRR